RRLHPPRRLRPRRPPPRRRRLARRPPRRPQADPTAPRRRLDDELVRRGLVADSHQARAVVERGAVRVGGAPAANPSRLVSPGEPIAVEGPPPRFVSRGGLKLQAALDHFGVSLEG